MQKPKLTASQGVQSDKFSRKRKTQFPTTTFNWSVLLAFPSARHKMQLCMKFPHKKKIP